MCQGVPNIESYAVYRNMKGGESMTEEVIFIKAMEKAVANGFQDTGWLANATAYVDRWLDSNEYYQLIFQHAFARAFFGPGFRRHLQAMVVYEVADKQAPLWYLQRFL